MTPSYLDILFLDKPKIINFASFNTCIIQLSMLGLVFVYCMFVIVKYCMCYTSLELFCIADGNLDIYVVSYVYLEQ